MVDDRGHGTGGVSRSLSSPVHSIRQSESEADQAVVARHPTPVVLVVFDEFSGTTLLNDRMEIDAAASRNLHGWPKLRRFIGMQPPFILRHHCRCSRDLVRPVSRDGFVRTLAANYPGNLFQTIQSTGQFEMAVFEPATRLYSTREHRHKSGQTALQKTEGLIRNLSTIYLRDPPGRPRCCSGNSTGMVSRRQSGNGSQIDSRFREPDSLFGSWRSTRATRNFLNCLKSSVRPRFTFLHVELPHVPWVLFPTGEQYVHETSSEHPAGGFGVFSKTGWANLRRSSGMSFAIGCRSVSWIALWVVSWIG